MQVELLLPHQSGLIAQPSLMSQSVVVEEVVSNMVVAVELVDM
jgi:hypothetical protein|tara:strand:- start:705 stop:833 length:129 start_codon:yes stop_codon:yes gene_type:complete